MHALKQQPTIERIQIEKSTILFALKNLKHRLNISQNLFFRSRSFVLCKFSDVSNAKELYEVVTTKFDYRQISREKSE